MSSQAIKKLLAVIGLVTLALDVTGCAALIVGSVVGAGDLASYEYVNSSAPTSHAQPKLSLNDIE
jgi:hypothetical protein